MVESPKGKAFHELPLVLFSALATAGGGVGAAHFLLGLLGRGWALSRPEVLLLSGLLLAGVLVSIGHLGRPSRGHLALLGLGRSPLSNEIGILGLVLFLAASHLVLPAGPWLSILGFLTSLASVMLLLALGGVYVLPGQVAWRGLAATSPLVMGMAWGLLLNGFLGPETANTLVWLTLWVGLVLDGLVFLRRWQSLERIAPESEVSHPSLFRRRRGILILRLLFSPLAASVALGAGMGLEALLLLSLALLADRFGFYAMALRQTTESEVARVESLLQG